MAESTELALVTGGETGIGEKTADLLRTAGFEVRTASRRSGCDLTDRDAIERLVASLPRLDVLVNNAGIAESAPVAKTTDDSWDRHFALNVTAPFLLVRAALPLLRKSQRACIVNVASTAGRAPAPYIAAYAASKQALLGLTRVLAAELKDIRVGAVLPGFVDTPLLDRSVKRIVQLTGRSEADARATLAARNPRGQLLVPDLVAAAVLEIVLGDETGVEVLLE